MVGPVARNDVRSASENVMTIFYAPHEGIELFDAIPL